MVEARFEPELDGEGVDTDKECVLVTSGAELVGDVVFGGLVEEVVGSGLF